MYWPHDSETFKKSSRPSIDTEARVVQESIILTESQLAALEKAR